MPGEILLPPSPNWFFNNGVDSRGEDGIIAAASFKTVVIYQVQQEKTLPKVIKVLFLSNGKALLVRLHPEASNTDYGHTVACVDDSHCITLLCLHTGTLIAKHKEHQQAINALAWGVVEEEHTLVTVGSGGKIVTWQPKYNVTRAHTLPYYNELTAIEVNPKDASQAIVSALKSLLLVSLKDGNVLVQLKGHEYEIYCIRWYSGEGSPLEADLVATNTRAEALRGGQRDEKPQSDNSNEGSDLKDWRSGQVSRNSIGPFFVSSDYGRNILVWDVSAKRYIAKAIVPLLGQNYKKQGKDNKAGKQHVALAWHGSQLYSSTTKGELLNWSLRPGTANYNNYKMVNHLHNRAIYNLEIVGDIVVSSGQDRTLHGYHLSKGAHMFQLPTLGACATTLSFCPQDSNRLAIGAMDSNIKVINFGSHLALKAQNIFYTINGKVLAMSWHPHHEGWLLFGTSSGQVGWIDVGSGRVNTFAHHHQRSVYKVEWAPPVCPSSTANFEEDCCAYSFADGGIVMRSCLDPMADPIDLKKLLPENETFLGDITEFSFSPDYLHLAIGAQDGKIQVYRTSDLVLVVTLAVVKKAVQHLLWQPPKESHFSEVLAVSSKEKEIYLFDMMKHLHEDQPGGLVTQAKRELRGHESRVVWLAWSPHQHGVLASASYDNTVQLWNANTGEAKLNYGGHTNRVFRVEFSPTDPDLLFSFAEENCVHMWRPSELTSKTLANNKAILKEFPTKKVQLQDPKSIEESNPAVPAEPATKKVGVSESSSSTSKTSNTGSSSTRQNNKPKSLFPKLHSVCSKKKSFHQLMILDFLGQSTPAKQQVEEGLEEECTEETEEDHSSDQHSAHAIKSTESYSWLLEKDVEMPEANDIEYGLNVYGPPPQMDALLLQEIQVHEQKGNDMQASVMHLWRGSLGEHIRTAARQRKLNEYLVASAPQVSLQLWQFACEAYAEQLVSEGDIIAASSYLMNIFRIKDAIDLLLKHRYYREALAVTKSRLGCNEELLTKVVSAWVTAALHEGNCDIATLLHLSIGQVEAAAGVMARKNDVGSLFVAAKLYQAAGNTELAAARALWALKEASLKHDHQKTDQILKHFPDLSWFRAISCSHICYLKLLNQYHIEEKTQNSIKKENTPYEKSQQCVASEMEVETLDSHDKDIDEGTSKENIDDVNLARDTTLVEEVHQQWQVQGMLETDYPTLYQSIVQNFSMQQVPTTLKQLWFLVAMSLCKMQLSPSKLSAEEHLVTALGHTMSMGKADQLYHLTHALLTKGPSNLSTLGCHFQEAEESTSATTLLRQLYYASEISLLHGHLHSSHTLLGNTSIQPLSEDKDGQESTAKNKENKVESGAGQNTQPMGQKEDEIGQPNEIVVMEKELDDKVSITPENLQTSVEKNNENEEALAVPELQTKFVPHEGSQLADNTPVSYIPPKSACEIISILQHYISSIDKNFMQLHTLAGLTSTMPFHPHQVLNEIVSRLKVKEELKESDISNLIQGLAELSVDT